MFKKSWLEKDEAKIVDAPITAFKEFLLFFYLDEVELIMAKVAKVIYIADKYIVAECLTVWRKFIANTLNDESVF